MDGMPGPPFTTVQVLLGLCGILATLLIASLGFIARGRNGKGQSMQTAGEQSPDFWLRRQDEMLGVIRGLHVSMVERMEGRLEKMHGDLIDRFDTLIEIQRGRRGG